jgi:hypothetical protein
MPDPIASALTLIQQADAALFLSSRSAYPQYVEVLAAKNNPWFSGCEQVRVELWTVGLATTGQQPRMLDAKTIQLRDDWFDSWDELLLSWGGYLDCRGKTTLSFNGYTGPVVFMLCEPNGDEIGRSVAVPIGSLPSGAAQDEQPGFFDPVIEAGNGAIDRGLSLVKVATITGIVVGGLILAPQIRALVDGVTDAD